MAGSFSSLSPVKRSHVFPSFHGPDVRRGFLSFLHNIFAKKDIPIFKDQEMERGNTIGPMLVKAIREAKVSIVLISKNYASSSWCLDELVEILKCKDAIGHIVMPVFYDVDPSDVRKQKGDFGIAFQKSCEGRAKKVVQKWKIALAYIATIAGEHSHNWTDEAAMVEKLSIDVSNKLKEEELKEEFRRLDVDHNGFITAAELRYIMTIDGDKVTGKLVCALIRAADVDGDGQISYDEFVKLKTDEAAMVENLKVEKLKEEFRSYDVDQNGFITATELRYILTKDADKVTDEQVRAIIRAADIDGDGQISYDEFVKITKINEAGMVEKLSVDVSNKLEVEKLKDEFRRYDVDHNGFITEAELRYIMTIDGKKVTDEKVCGIMRAADVDGDGRISYDEFVKIETLEQTMKNSNKDSDMNLGRMKSLFRALDEDDNGFLTAADVQLWLSLSGDKVTNEEIRTVIRAADVDGDGRISYDEFVKFYSKAT